MFALDLFNNDHERRLAEGAVDQLEQRRIDDLAMKMDDLVARAKKASTPEVRAALVKEFQKCKDERDSYYKIKDECMGYGGLGEAGIGQDIVNKQEKMARATPPTPAGKVASTVKNAAKWLAGKGGPGQEGPTYEAQEHNEDNYEQLLNAIAALYGPEIWDNDAMGDLANDLEQANPTPEELNFIIKNGKLPKRLQGIKFTNNDTVQFGEAAYTGDHDTDEKRIQQLMRKYHWSRQEAEEHLTSSESDHEKFDESSDTTLQQWTASVKQKFPDARFVQNKTTGEYIAQSTQGQGIVSRWNNGIKESSQKKNSEQVKEHHFIYEVRYGHPPGAGYFGDQWIQQGQAMQNQQAQAQKPQEDPWTGAAHGSSAQELDMFKAGKKPVSIQRIDDPLWKPLVDSGVFRRVGDCPTPWPCFVIAVRDEVLNKHPNTIKQILEIINIKTKKFKEIEKIETTLATKYHQQIDDIQEWLRLTEWSQKPLSEKMLNKIQNQLFDLKIIDKIYNSAEILKTL